MSGEPTKNSTHECCFCVGATGFEPASALGHSPSWTPLKTVHRTVLLTLRPSAPEEAFGTDQRSRNLCYEQTKNSTYGCCFCVGATGFEPATSASRTQRSTKLSHAPCIYDESRAITRRVYKYPMQLDIIILLFVIVKGMTGFI